MWRIIHVCAIAMLIGSAIYSYSIKYETIWYAEQVVKLKNKIQREHDDISVLRAEWAHLTRPERIQTLIDRHMETQVLSLTQIVRATDLPDKAVKVDAIGRKLEALGFAEPTNTPGDSRGHSATPAPDAAR